MNVKYTEDVWTIFTGGRRKKFIWKYENMYSLGNTASNIKMKETTSRAQRRAIEVLELV